MRSCNSYCLYKSLRMVNVMVNIFGMIIIIYSLWLLKMWIHGVAQLPSSSHLPRPWYVGAHHKEFKRFFLFHLLICRLIAILVLVAQIHVVVLASILWAVGAEPIIHHHISGTFDVRQSFLADFNSPAIPMDDRGSLEEILKSYMAGIFTNSCSKFRTDQS
ncbi:hypothetical protein U1Q18_021764 [Sarracenia purpurea var. burkii]